MKDEVKNFAEVLKATSSFEVADILFKGFVKARPQYDFNEVLSIVVETDERFIGYVGVLVFKYTSANINTNGLAISAVHRRVLTAANYEITITAKEI